MELTGRTIMVTGAGQGIGPAVVSMAMDLGVDVVLIDRNPATLRDAVAALGQERAVCFLLSEGVSYAAGENPTASGGSHMQP